MTDYHEINADLGEAQDAPHWEQESLRNLIGGINNLLSSHAEFQKRYPEETNEAHH